MSRMENRRRAWIDDGAELEEAGAVGIGKERATAGVLDTSQDRIAREYLAEGEIRKTVEVSAEDLRGVDAGE